MSQGYSSVDCLLTTLADCSLTLRGNSKEMLKEKEDGKEEEEERKEKKVMNMCSRHSLNFGSAITVARKK